MSIACCSWHSRAAALVLGAACRHQRERRLLGIAAVCAVRPCGLARQRLGLLHTLVRSLRQGRLRADRAAHAARAGVEAAGVPAAYAREEALLWRRSRPRAQVRRAAVCVQLCHAATGLLQAQDLLRTCYHHGYYPIRHRHHPTATATATATTAPPPPPHRHRHRHTTTAHERLEDAEAREDADAAASAMADILGLPREALVSVQFS